MKEWTEICRKTAARADGSQKNEGGPGCDRRHPNKIDRVRWNHGGNSKQRRSKICAQGKCGIQWWDEIEVNLVVGSVKCLPRRQNYSDLCRVNPVLALGAAGYLDMCLVQ
jgi:hypothetical protein